MARSRNPCRRRRTCCSAPATPGTLASWMRPRSSSTADRTSCAETSPTVSVMRAPGRNRSCSAGASVCVVAGLFAGRPPLCGAHLFARSCRLSCVKRWKMTAAGKRSRSLPGSCVALQDVVQVPSRLCNCEGQSGTLQGCCRSRASQGMLVLLHRVCTGSNAVSVLRSHVLFNTTRRSAAGAWKRHSDQLEVTKGGAHTAPEPNTAASTWWKGSRACFLPLGSGPLATTVYDEALVLPRPIMRSAVAGCSGHGCREACI